MKQVLQSLKTGAVEVVEVPAPVVRPGALLVRTRVSLISAGTERMLLDFGRAGWIEKARQQPDKVRQVLEKLRTDGLGPTIQAVRHKLDQPLALGYCNIGVVQEVGSGVLDFAPGDRVASNGTHAEVVCVPKTLCAKVPDSVSDDEAAFTVVAAIALQGIRLVQPTLGEAVVVTGLGLIGLLTVQLLRAHGCRVLGLDFHSGKLDLARRFGAETVDLSAGVDPVAAAHAFSRGDGVDAVLITASTRSSDPVRQAARMCRKRGRIVLVGVTGLELSRDELYQKELTFQVACSYGPGRYDQDYEEKGHDYPIGFVRWTAQRNFEAVLNLMADGRLDVNPLISHRFAIDEAEQAYDVLAGTQSALGILLQYPHADQNRETALRNRTVRVVSPPRRDSEREKTVGEAVVAFVGAGNYATGVLIPAFQAAGARLKVVASRGGVSALHAGRKFGFEEATSDIDRVFSDPQVNVVVIATRHDSHARFVCQALTAGKHVFVEKPLCLTLEELKDIETRYTALLASHTAPPLLMVGFNRRFAPQVQRMKALLDGMKGPKSFIATVNAGAVPAHHWTHDPSVGGGRIVGEACHFVDLLRHLAASPVVGVQAAWLGGPSTRQAPRDTGTFTLHCADGSIGTVHYLASGHRAFPKERLDVFGSGRSLHLDNFRRLRGYGWPGFRKMNLWTQDKGQTACVTTFLDAIRHGRPAPIPFEELLEVSRVTIQISQQQTDRPAHT